MLICSRTSHAHVPVSTLKICKWCEHATLEMEFVILWNIGNCLYRFTWLMQYYLPDNMLIKQNRWKTQIRLLNLPKTR